jgi:hypothetical protein
MSLEDKKGMNDLMQRSLKHIQMLATFDKYKLLLLYDNNHYIYMLFITLCAELIGPSPRPANPLTDQATCVN